MSEIKVNTDKDASAFYAQIPEEILRFLENYFLIEQEDPDLEIRARAELLTRVLIKVMLQLYRLGIDDDFQPVFVAMNYVKPHSGDVTECKRTYEVIGGEPYGTFNLGFLTNEYENAYKLWIKDTFGVELSEKASEIFQQWGDATKKKGV